MYVYIHMTCKSLVGSPLWHLCGEPGRPYYHTAKYYSAIAWQPVAPQGKPLAKWPAHLPSVLAGWCMHVHGNARTPCYYYPPQV